MPRFWDFQCPIHGVYEVLMDGPPPEAIHCPEEVLSPAAPAPGFLGAAPVLCSLVARRVWTHAPMVGGKEKGIYPRFDMQLGVEVQSKAHEKQLLANHPDGPRIKMGVDEWERQAFSQSESEDVLGPEDKIAFREAAQKAYHDVVTRAIPLEDHPPIEAVEAGPIIVPDPKE